MERIREQVDIVVNAIDEKGGQDTVVMDVAKQTSIADYFIITSGSSSTQVSAIADEVEKQMDLNGFGKINRSGYSSARWVLIDYGNVIVHVFHKEERQYYDLERLWKSVEENLKEDN